MGAPLHHLAIGTRDVGRLADFYVSVLGLQKVERPDDGAGNVWLRLGGGSVLMIEKTEDGPVVSSGSKVEAGLFLFVLCASEEIDARLALFGMEAESQTEYTRYYRDPDGNRFGVSSYAFS